MIDRAQLPSPKQHKKMREGWKDFVVKYYSNMDYEKVDVKAFNKIKQIFAQHFNINNQSINAKIEEVFKGIGSGYNALFKLIKMDEDEAEKVVDNSGTKSGYLMALQAMMGARYADNKHDYKKEVLSDLIKSGLIKMRYNAWKNY